MLVRSYSRFVAVSVFLLLIAGALVTSTGSGLAVPDWPLSYGKLMPPMVGGILFEHGHRMIAAAVSTLVGIQIAVLFIGKARPFLKKLGILAFGAILAQAVLGGLTVLFLLPPAVSSAHAGLAQIVFALCSSIAFLSSRPEAEPAPEGLTPSGRLELESAFRRTVLATGAAYLQIILGAVVRHTGAGLAIPDFPLAFGQLFPPASAFSTPGVPMHTLHRYFAYVVAALVISAAVSLRKTGSRFPAFRKAAWVWLALLAIQITLGATSVWTKKAVAATVSHLAGGALLFVTGVLTAVALARLRKAAGPVPAQEKSSVPSRGRDLLELTKPRITLFVVMTAYVGFVVGAKVPVSQLDFFTLLHTLVGTALVASGTSVFNQLWEIELDRRMKRTSNRPLPAGRISPMTALVFGLVLSIAGIAELAAYANVITSVLAASTLLSYVFVYTPMKTRSPLSTIVGAIPGALPPLGGFTASHGVIAAEGIVLFAILFLWQLPHFFAIGWKHRKDYGEAGCRILAVIDPSGKSSGRQALWYTGLLLPVSMAPAFLGTTGTLYGVAALLMTSLFFLSSLQFAKETTDRNATRLFLMSIGWLPAVLILLLVNRATGV